MRRTTLLAAALSAAFSFVFIVRASFLIDGRRYFTLFDDAMVSMRYARMLATGHGLVWNAGEPPVEGYTNLLWTLWMSLLHFTRVPDRLMSLLVSVSGAALVVLSALLAARIVRRLAPDDDGRGETAAALLVGACYPLLFWTLRGMEVGLLAWLVLLAVDLALGLAEDEERAAWPLGIVLAAMALTRSDGIVPALTIGACAVWSMPTTQRRRHALVVCGLPVLAVAAHTLFRLRYYGAPMPNTYYLKMSGVPASIRLGRGYAAIKPAFVKYLLLPLLVAAANREAYRRRPFAFVFAVPLVLVAYSIYVGGDAWEWMPVVNRYVAPGVPLLLVGAAATFASEASPGRIGASRSALVAVCGTILVAAVVSGPGFADWIRTAGSHVDEDRQIAEIGVLVRDTTSETTRIGVVWAGLIPYFSHRNAVDFLGKNDPVIARRPPVLPFYPGHDRFDYDYSIGVLRPDLVVQLWFPTPHVFQLLQQLGYQQVFGGIYARKGSGVEVERLRRKLQG